MAGCAMWSRRFLTALLLVFLLGCGIVAWRERAALLSWFYVHNLAHASESSRQRWLGRVANLGEMALPGLLDCLKQADSLVCANARAALELMTRTWGSGDARTADLALRLAREFDRFSVEGQKQVLDLAADWFRAGRRQADGPARIALASACGNLLGESAAVNDEEVRAGALELCGLLLSQPGEKHSGKPLDPALKLAASALRSSSADNRLHAVRLSLHPGMADLLEQVATLLGDESVQVRRAALVAVSRARDAVHDDQLLPLFARSRSGGSPAVRANSHRSRPAPRVSRAGPAPDRSSTGSALASPRSSARIHRAGPRPLAAPSQPRSFSLGSRRRRPRHDAAELRRSQRPHRSNRPRGQQSHRASTGPVLPQLPAPQCLFVSVHGQMKTGEIKIVSPLSFKRLPTRKWMLHQLLNGCAVQKEFDFLFGSSECSDCVTSEPILGL
jgi:hypothetical protein